MMKQLLLLTLLLAAASSCRTDTVADPYASLRRAAPFSMPSFGAPKFPDTRVLISTHGGVGDGLTLNTEAFARAMKTLDGMGGGHLVVPAGIWLTGPIVLHSNVDLHLEKGAVILFSPDKTLYPIVNTIFEGLDTRRCQSPISGRNLENVAITGEGAIDGNGHVWRPLKRDKVSAAQWQRMTRGGVFKREDYWYPSESYLKGEQASDMNVPRGPRTDEQWEEIKDFLRPVMVNFIRCKNVYLQGVIFQNSPAWCLHPLLCENVIVDAVTVRNPAYAQNGDGIDLESCRNAIIVNSSFDVGDDGICIKSGKDQEGRLRAAPCENVLVDNCTVYKGHGGFVVGSEMSGGVRNIRVSNCKFLGTDVGLRFKSRRGRGGVVENIYAENISMMDIPTEPILFDLFYGGQSAVEALASGQKTPDVAAIPPANETTPAFRNIFIKGVRCTNARRAMFFNGLPEQRIYRVEIEDAVITARLGAELKNASRVRLKNITVHAESGAALILHDCNNVKVADFRGFVSDDTPKARLSGTLEDVDTGDSFRDDEIDRH
ncbi:MAG: glycoside hydrolase family 28 protein [Odoribacteraceae bacterium]|jgi:polygalacturonase|nr:glycoside hydrolase family 28 protein [Odoribacteraceae bacterium]